jgi:hypothetical protein
VCLSCGCGRPSDPHGDPANITMAVLLAAAAAGNVSPSEAAANILAGVGGKKGDLKEARQRAKAQEAAEDAMVAREAAR